jgi:hypothetical protein
MRQSSTHDRFARGRVLSAAACIAAAFMLSGCWWDSNSTSTTTTTTPPPASGSGLSVDGSIYAGTASGATVTAYALNADGTLGASLGSATSGADGSYSVALSSVPTGPLVLVASGGTYTAESDGASITLGDLRAVVAAVGSTGTSGVVITPLSDMVTARVEALAAAGGAIDAALASASDLVKSTYGFTGPIASLVPLFDKASIGSDGYLLGLVLGSLDTCAKSAAGASRGSLYTALSSDFADGSFDGRLSGTPITLGAGSLSSTAGTSDFLGCVAGYASSGKAVLDAGVSLSDLAATVTLVRTAIATSAATPKSIGLAAGSSGAISTLAYGGKQWVFIAARSAGVVAIDVTDPTAASPTVKTFSSLVTNFGGQQIGGVVPLLGADHPQLLVFAYGSKHIALVDADTGAVDYEADLPLAATSPVGFSGGSAYIAGAIPDTGRDGVWLATADGYLFFNRATHAIGTQYAIDPSAQLAENLGGDIQHGLLFAPNYAPGIQLVDLVAGKSYYLDGSAYTNAFLAPAGGYTPLSYPDAGSVDAGFQVGIVTNEDTDDVGFINLKTIVKTDVTGAKSTFAPASGGSALAKLGGPTLSGSAVDSDTHLVMFMAGYSSDVAVGMLQDPASVAAGATWAGLTDWRFVLNLTGYSYARDPHAAAAIKNLSNGKAYGYLLDGGVHKAFQIDLAAFLGAAAQGTTGSAAHQLAADPTTNGIVKSITW